MLVKISIGGMTRTRRIQENEGGTPWENAVQLALQIMKGFQQALEWKPHDKADPAIMLAFLKIFEAFMEKQILEKVACDFG